MVDEFGLGDEVGDDMWSDNYIFTHDPKPIIFRSFDWDWQCKFTNGDVQDGGCCETEDDAYEEARQHYLENKE
jgi:hypothetical protein